jgi:phospholipase/lecithinase/hemolysin
VKKSAFASLVALTCLVFPGDAVAGYSSLYVFGDSLSDSGNNAIVLAPNVTPVPIPGNAFIPTFPYASGRYTNGRVWAQILASSLGLSADPSLLGGTDYAFGGAVTGPLAAVPPSVGAQTALFLNEHGNRAPSDALYLVEGGGEDILHALGGIAGCGGSPLCIDGITRSTVAAFAANSGNIVAGLQHAGAREIIVWDVPDVGTAPALRAAGTSSLATAMASSMNRALASTIGGNPAVDLFDAFGLLDEVIADPSTFGLSNVTDACAQSVDCDPSQYLFWDGIHPTSAAEAIISDAIGSLITNVPEPPALSLLGLALGALLFARRRPNRRRPGAANDRDPRLSARRSG